MAKVGKGKKRDRGATKRPPPLPAAIETANKRISQNAALTHERIKGRETR